MPSRLLTAAELAPLLGVSTQTINSLRKAGGIRYYRLGRAYRYDLEEVREDTRGGGPNNGKRERAGRGVVRELMGHASITTTERYAHLAPDANQTAAAAIDAHRANAPAKIQEVG